MNSVCPECGGRLKVIRELPHSADCFYGCVDCHLVFWGNEKDPVPSKK